MTSFPASEPVVLPAFAVYIEATVIAKDRDAAVAWAADQLERICDDEASLSGMAEVGEKPVEFFDAE